MESAEYAQEAAEAMGITADRLKKLDLIDSIIDEPDGGAHRNHKLTANLLKHELEQQLQQLQTMAMSDVIQKRLEKLRSIGQPS